ncbi:MAG: DUF4149 domain-containing protein [Burkholderiales bacterium]|nr:DUF4149 domain-containing protein [Burkholderiales bacterium]
MPKKQAKKSIQSLEILSVHQIAKLAMTFWVGGTLTVGCIIVPLLFKNLDEITAATIAGQIFNIVAYIGMVSLFMALIEIVMDYKLQIFHLRRFWYIAFMETILFINYFAISPIIVKLRVQLTDITNRVFQHTTEFSFWHSVSSILFLISCVLGVLYILEKNYK